MIKTYDVIEIFYYKGKQYAPAWLLTATSSSAFVVPPPSQLEADPDDPTIKQLIDAGFLKERE